MQAQEEEEAEAVRQLPTSDQPTPSEYRDHCISHYPYRPWCKHCVEGRGREFKHATVEKTARGIPTISFDYAFMGDKGEISSEDQADTEEGSIKVLVIRDRLSKAIFAVAVPKKGIDKKRFSVAAIVDAVKWLGYVKVMLKTDNEPAILKLLSEAVRELRIQEVTQAMTENSPEYDPQANGNAEAGVRIWKGQFRTLRSDLEEVIGYRIPARHPVMAWLVRHAADVLNWSAKAPDGKTPYHKVRGKPFQTRILRFGEVCQFKTRAHEPISAVGDGKKWHSGVFVGIDKRTGQYMVHDDDEIKYARTVIRLPEVNKFQKDALSRVKAAPYDMHQAAEPEVIFRDKKEPEHQTFENKVALSRQVYIKASDIREYGLTRGCPRCDHELAYGPNRTSKPHSQVCRARIMAELSKTEAGRIRIGAAAERLDRTAAELGQQHRTDVPQGEQNGEVVQHQQPVEPVEPPQNPFEFIPLGTPEQHAQPVVQPALQEPSMEQEVAEPVNDEREREDRIAADPGMDVDVVYDAYPRLFDRMTDVSPGRRPPTLLMREENPKLTVRSRVQEDEAASEADLKELLNVMTREIKEEIREH